MTLIGATVVGIHIPLMIGPIVGLLSAEDRDSNVLPAIFLTQPSLDGLQLSRIGLGTAVTFVVVLNSSLIGDVTHRVGFLGIGVAAAASTTIVPVVALLVARLAGDRAQALAIVKTMSVVFYIPVIAEYAPGPLRAGAERHSLDVAAADLVGPTPLRWSSLLPRASGSQL